MLHYLVKPHINSFQIIMMYIIIFLIKYKYPLYDNVKY